VSQAGSHWELSVADGQSYPRAVDAAITIAVVVSDTGTASGDKIVPFTLAASLCFRVTRNKPSLRLRDDNHALTFLT